MHRSKVIVYTREGGEVSLCSPSSTALRYMTGGGGRWSGMKPGFIDRQIHEQSRYGVGERYARQFIMAMQLGGCTDAEAYGIMRDRFCSHLGTAHELYDIGDIPVDRWFRNAWRRSHNGGPLYINMNEARKIQIKKLQYAARANNAAIQIWRWRQSIRSAETPEALKVVWPKGLQHG